MTSSTKTSTKRKNIASNRKARFEYEILDTFEAGLVLEGPEVKSLRAGNANLNDAYATIRKGEAFLMNAYIGPYEQAAQENAASRRRRKLLLHRREINRLAVKVAERGFSLVPLSLYFKKGRVKVELALVRGKRQYDKRETIRKREDDRNLQRVLRRGSRYSE